jgi:ABC-type multidrug transport system fused ATPase/permease subunit
MLVAALAEVATVSSLMPFLALLSGAGHLERLPVAAELIEASRRLVPGQPLLGAGLIFIAAVLVTGAIRVLLSYATNNFALSLGHELSVEVQRRILLQPYSYHVSHSSSEMVTALEKVQILVSGVVLQLMESATAGVIILFVLAVLIQIDVVMAAAAVAIFVLFYALLSAMIRHRLARNSSVLGSAYERRVQLVQESAAGIRDVIIDQSAGVYLDAFRQVDHDLSVAIAHNRFLAVAPRFVVETAGTILIAALAFAAAARPGGLNSALPVLGTIALAAQRLLPLAQQLYKGWADLAGNRAIVQQVVSYLHLPVAGSRLRPAAPLDMREGLTLDRIVFTYPSRSEQAVDDVTLTIPRGSRIALVGRTGAGKSTLADLIMGLLEPDSGRLLVDGTPLTAATLPSWQAGIAHVPQSIFLADASIAENIALGVPGSGVDIDRVQAAARAAQLHDFVAALPEGYGTGVGERGIRLSGGQRQRLGLARAIYKHAPVLVLDEATSALDHATERAVLAALDELGRGGCTIIIIAHRESTLAGCDLIARLDHGRLVATSTPAASGGKAAC